MKKIALVLGVVLLCSPMAAFAEWRAAPPQHGPRDAPPSPREERRVERRGYVWNGGYYGYRHNRYSWTPGRLVHERRGRDWQDGRWERHDDHYDWYRGEWRPR
jgi:hypothetical protein